VLEIDENGSFPPCSHFGSQALYLDPGINDSSIVDPAVG